MTSNTPTRNVYTPATPDPGIEREKISQSQDKPKSGGSKTAVPGK
jgi:hypothetical protein